MTKNSEKNPFEFLEFYPFDRLIYSNIMTVWALSDLHLAFGNPAKTMEVFGPNWKGYASNIEKNWKRCVKDCDLVIIAGDISWASKEKEVSPDLDFLESLPGEKLLLRGNHDYWWPSASKLKKLLPPSLHFIQNSVFNWNGISFGGSRLWDSKEYNFSFFIEFINNPYQSRKKNPSAEETEKVFLRELERLTLSLKQLDPKAKTRIALTHYPPIGANLEPSRASTIFENFGIDICVFGHLHNVKFESLPFGKARGVQYILSSADYLSFTPIKILN